MTEIKNTQTIDAMPAQNNRDEETETSPFAEALKALERIVGHDIYAAVSAPEVDLTVIRIEDAAKYLPCFDEADECINIFDDSPVMLCYDPRQVIEIAGKSYLSGAVVFTCISYDGNYLSLTAEEIYNIQKYLKEHSVPLMAGKEQMICICID